MHPKGLAHSPLEVRLPLRTCLLISFGALTMCAVASCSGGPTSPGREVVSVEVTPQAGAVPVGGTRAFTAVAKDAEGRRIRSAEVSWTISNAIVASVDEEGVVTGMSIGSATVNALAGEVTGTAALTVVQRSTTDRPDQVSGPQIHFLYIIPQDGQDDSLDLEGSLLNSVGSVQTWLAGQTGGRTLRMDTFEGVLDVSFARLDQTGSEISASGEQADDIIRAKLLASGFDNTEKLYVIYYDGEVTSQFCTRRESDQPVRMLYFFLGRCDHLRFADSPTDAMKSAEATLMHDILHLLGFVGEGAPHEVNGHVTDDPQDIMDFNHPSPPYHLDVGRDDYYGENVPEGVLNFVESPFLN